MHPEIHLVSQGDMSLESLLAIAAEAHPFVDFIHLREKRRTAKELLRLVEEMSEQGVPLDKVIVNDRLDVGLACGAGGVQLAGHSLSVTAARRLAPGVRLGCSVHSPEEAAAAAKEGADFCLYGHVYATASKPGLPARGIGGLQAAVRACPVPVIAIGGISPEQAREVLRTGAAGFAVLSGICGAEDPASAARAYREAAEAAFAFKEIAEGGGGVEGGH
ncbi:thiamine phosphate synthase [Paenibacillus sp. HN-1]|uniref:thiamine phosphate synthase n=1 Tax=Paenibacillus TaxID=44249 RepID=UPI001CA7D40E|nr:MULTISPECIES: thiamine phosphate synthase [Paenibacillus]MBY9080336.1 thiamine phosphate synthase [Paenibacillus sp. CGMCC 1.18879]MBY9083005.1 thiamine phosphate synthase [Paenibacillus sinensis]